MNGEEPMTFMMLPNDVVINCLARVSRLYYPTLSLVSKSLHSLLASTELYQTRILFGRTESCLYVCFTGKSIPQQWFTLCQRPNSSKKVLAPITSPNSLCMYQSDFAKVGSNIYAIGGSNSNTYPNGGYFEDDSASSSVMVMDCHSHTWREAPSMRVARLAPSACVLDGKIYVMGGCKNLDATNWMEVFDTKKQTWEFDSSNPSEKICSGYRYQSIGCDGNIYVQCSEEHVIYKLNKGRWRAGDLAINRKWYSGCFPLSVCVIDNVLYSCFCGQIAWYNFEERYWECLKGLEGLGKLCRPNLVIEGKVAEYGGKLAVLWEDNMFIEKKVWCAEIALEKRQGDIWGTLEWFDVVFTTTETAQYYLAHIVAVTL